jgi:ectoine hydroxylase-related dioxygenase (phytanoyl-CoA dioxygenase family)
MERPGRYAHPNVPVNELRERYDQQGWVGPVVLDAEFDLDRLRGDVAASPAAQNGDAVLCPHLLSEEVARIVDDPVLAAWASALLEEDDLVVWSSTLFRKEPGAAPFYWHQDAPSWHVEPMRVVSAWIALDPADLSNGCVRVVSGGHRQIYERERRPGGVSSKAIREEDLDMASETPMEMQPGQGFVFSPYLPHCSGANHSGSSRWGMAVRYGSSDIRVDFARFSIYARRPDLWKVLPVPVGGTDAR